MRRWGFFFPFFFFLPAHAGVSGSRLYQAYYQAMTEGGRQQPQCLNETRALANW